MTILTPTPVDRFDAEVDPRTGNPRDTFFEVVIDTLDNVKEFANSVRDDLARIASGELTDDVMMMPSDDVISVQAAASAVISKVQPQDPFRTNMASDMAIWQITEQHRYILDLDAYFGQLDFLDYIKLIQTYSVRSPLSRIIGQVPAILSTDALAAIGVDPSTYQVTPDHLVTLIPFFGRLS